MKIGVYPGSFDPLTKGHQNIIGKAMPFFDEIHIVIAKNSKKIPLIPIQDKKLLIEELYKGPLFKIVIWEGLIVDYCKSFENPSIIRGLRAISDFENEFSMYHANKSLDKYETVFFMADREYMFVSSSMVREIYSTGETYRLFNYIPSNFQRYLKKIKNENISN